MREIFNINPKWHRCFLALAALCISGFVLSPVKKKSAVWQKENQPALKASEISGAVGEGILLGIFGGFRPLLADLTWLRAYVNWEKRDLAANDSLMKLAITLAPENDYFWLNAADVIAYDQSYWEIQHRSRNGKVPLDAAVVSALHKDFCEKGLALLEEGAGRLKGREALFYVRSAQICQNKLKDFSRAAEYYRRAAECENPAWYAALVYLDILENVLGKRAEAHAWCRAYSEHLERTLKCDPYGIRVLIWDRLQKMEEGVVSDK